MRDALDLAHWTAKELVNYVVAFDMTDYVEWGYNGNNEVEFSPSLDVIPTRLSFDLNFTKLLIVNYFM